MTLNHTDEVYKLPGLPDMYHWEFSPQDTKVS